MENEDLQQTLNKRNTETIYLKVKELEARIFNQAEQILTQQVAINSMQERMTALEQMLVIQKAMMTGMGPSVR